ncbi:hypothetical protein OVA29_17965 [Exiguobacterium sp. SL14]|nr:hypothetical protein [Exiguobacterium sp. SL14]MCY1692232.1 hypothetical protein [Exiguobacterium sp. SL14]
MKAGTIAMSEQRLFARLKVSGLTMEEYFHLAPWKPIKVSTP